MTGQSASAEEDYVVVINDEEQYSIWRDGRAIPAGWRAVGKKAPKSECLEYIEEVWTDMRPLSLRKRMAANAGRDMP
jgi:MbtH protein